MKFTDTSPDQILKGGTPAGGLDPLFHVTLIEPEIPQNTGNIGRTCVGFRSDLQIVGETGFNITDKNLKRAGLDYWQHLSWKHFEDIPTWEQQLADPLRVFYFSAFATRSLYDQNFRRGDNLVFGKETKGLPEEILQRNKDRMLLIPILGPVRGYNVSTAVAMVLTEAYRQIRDTV